MSTNQSAGSEPLSLPHFDEEATLLSARPVVPLHQVIAENRSKRRLILVSAIVAAVLVGAIGASILLRSGEQETSGVPEAEQGLSVNAGSDSQQNGANLPSGNPGTSAIDGEPPALAEQTNQRDPPSTIERKSRKSPVTRRPASPISSIARPTQTLPAQRAGTTQDDEDYLYEEERRLLQEERREARRLRRERRNRRARRPNANQRDL